MEKDDDLSVKVAVRIRPQLASEKIEMCQICTTVIPREKQVVLGKDKAFTFDYVCDLHCLQAEVYETCADELVNGTFEGLNATLLAYGQTGSGKTYTMGTNFDVSLNPEQIGIIPRALDRLFNGIAERKKRSIERNETPPEFKINAQFMELYNEEIFDLLDTTRDPSEKNRKSHIKIHEDAHGGIYTIGLTARPVVSQQDALLCLKTGTLLRSTASTNMNATSSRSHAVFTLHVRQQRIFKVEVNKDEQDGESGDREGSGELPSGELEVLTAKFNFVDLAGSERLKRTGATGDRAKEGISINCGLLALGNVISALGDVEKRGCHVPYRDSKLTRLLQDSLGGNSRTTMIACISPSDRDFMETLNTLKYANRARNIRNKVVANKDMASCQLSAMRAEIQALQRELMEFKMGKQISGVGENFHDAILENQMLQSENESLRQRVKSLQGTIDVMATRNAQLQTERDLSNLGGSATEGETNEDVKKLLNGYIMETEQLRSKLTESESMVELMKQKRATPRSNSAFSDPFNCFSSMGFSFDPEDHAQQVISEAKADLENQLKVIHKREKMSESIEESQEQAATLHSAEEKDEGENSDVASSESDSETEENGRLEENLADLTCEISIKQKLIDELEASQKRLRMMKVQYEEKLTALENKIKQTESERDRVLSNLGSAESHATGKSKAVREEYDQKLNSMQSELRKLQAAKREHSKMMHNQTHYETQLRTLQRELSDLKRMKVKLMKQLQDESQKSRQTEQKFKKEVNQMKKQERLKDNQIKNLENEKKKRDVVLKRKLEEVEALRRKERNLMSAKAAGRVGKHGKSYSEMGRLTDVRQLKTSWDNLEKLIGSIITKKKTLFHLDKDMERWIKQRETVGKKLERFLKKQEKAMSGDCVDAADLSDLNNHIECVRDNLAYIQENINECQNCIVSLEEMKDEDIEPVNVFVNSSVREALYLLERCTSFAINNGILAAQKEDECRELVAKLHQEQMESIFQRDMLQYLIQDKVDVEIDHGIIWQDIDAESSSSSASVSPVDSLDNQMYPLTFDASRTDGAEDPGLGLSNKCESPVALLENEPPPAIMKCESNVSLDSLCSDAINKDQEVTAEMPNVPKKLNSADNKSTKQTLLGAPHEQRSRHSDSSVSPVRKPTTSTKGQASPLADRKERKSDKLSRSAVDAARQTMSVGVISDVTNANVAGKGTFPLSHHHTAAGHSKAVLSIFATNDRLFSSGKDHTAKIWDLSAGVETASFRNHPTSVVAVKFAEATGLVYTASAYLIKVWDPRLGSQCIYTFTSAGLVAESTNDGFSGPVICPPGEINISDIAISATGAMLYSAAGNTVRTWDMKMLRSIGKLYGGHQAAVMALAVNDVGLSSCNAVVATGSKDRCIKVFQLNRDLSGIISPKYSLEPTHCDGIESLHIADNLLFSGSRDMCIKKWDLNDGQLKQSITSAHRDWVSGLACLPPSDGRPSSGDGGMLLSICRAGSLKAWSTSNCCLIGETQAHVASINCITTSPSGLVFTGSSDRSIRIWKRSVDVVEKAV